MESKIMLQNDELPQDRCASVDDIQALVNNVQPDADIDGPADLSLESLTLKTVNAEKDLN